MDLVGVSEIAEMAGVSRQAVVNWRTRSKDFPTPMADLASGPIWKQEDIIAWLKSREGRVATKIVSFINLKGGVGKTTTTVALSEFLAEEYRKHVLVVDLDPQTNATIALIPEERWQERDEQGCTLKQLFLDAISGTTKFNIRDAIIKQVSNLHGGISRLDLLPSSLGLIELQDRLGLVPSQSFYSQSPVNVLKDALNPVLAEYDYVMIDCPPNLGIITLNGISISTGYVIPVIPDILSTYGIDQIQASIQKFTEKAGITVEPKGMIISKYRSISTLHNSTIQRLRQQAAAGKYPPVFSPVIKETNQIAQSMDVDQNPNTLRQKYGYSGNYDAYLSLAREFMNKC